jgi:hypothetical protein
MRVDRRRRQRAGSGARPRPRIRAPLSHSSTTCAPARTVARDKVRTLVRPRPRRCARHNRRYVALCQEGDPSPARFANPAPPPDGSRPAGVRFTRLAAYRITIVTVWDAVPPSSALTRSEQQHVTSPPQGPGTTCVFAPNGLIEKRADAYHFVTGPASPVRTQTPGSARADAPPRRGRSRPRRRDGPGARAPL